MSAFELWASRFGARWRKWLRDPAAFADELPSPAWRWLMVWGMAGFTLLSDAASLADRLCALAWPATGVRLQRCGPGGADYRFVTRSGGRPGLWPERVLVKAPSGAVVVAFGEGGEAMTAAETGPGRPGLVSLGGRPAWARVYSTEEGGATPEVLTTRPLGRAFLTRVLRRQGMGMAKALRAAWPPVERRAAEPSAGAYRAWRSRNEPRPSEAGAIRAWLAGRDGLPRISVLMPVRDPRPAHLEAAIRSVQDQAYWDWRLYIADDGSGDEDVHKVLDRAAQDGRIKLVRLEESQGVAVATNAALAIAEGEVALFLDHDDLLAPHALAMVADAFAGRPDAAAVFSDEDGLDAHGRRAAPLFKSDLDHERLLAQNHVNHLFAVRLDLLRRLGGLRTGLDGVQDHDLVLRVVESGEGPILHVPHVLYHWRIYPGGQSLSQRSKPELDARRVRAVRAHLERVGRRGSLEPGRGGHLVVRTPAPDAPPQVLALVPTRDRPGLLEACVTGLLEQTDYPALRVCIIDNGSRSDRALRLLRRLARTSRVDVLRIDEPFNFAALNNRAAASFPSQVLALVNDDVMVVEPGWLKAMVGLASLPDVGAVGAKLFYPDGRIQHAGITLGLGPHKVAGHAFRGAPGDSPGPQNGLLVAREVSAVTAACMVLETAKFQQAGGFDEADFPVAFNDVDLCLRLGRLGLRTLWTPQARLMHLESATRGPDKAGASGARLAEEAHRMRERWGARLSQDPYYNPNLTLEDESFNLADRTRAPAPWRPA